MKAGKRGDWRTARPVNGETFEELFQRMRFLLFGIVNFYFKNERIEDFSDLGDEENKSNRRVLVVCHGAWLRQLQDFLEKENYGIDYKQNRESVRNCSLSIITVEEGENGVQFEIEKFGDYRHLLDDYNSDDESGQEEEEGTDSSEEN